ncbi:hypothetical protein ccbrp13_21260 [Ktedonobacteria bacterium brp13]|nr:hypothetical protein ccbrp13_21260 [Ktedonobacteria bacterium brp13]
MSLHVALKNHLVSVLLLTGSGIIGSWIVWRRVSKKQENASHEEIDFPEWMEEDDQNMQEMTPLDENNQDMQVTTPLSEPPHIDTSRGCVLFHSYVFGEARESCTPHHWHQTYWLRSVAILDQEPRRAIVQHTDTQRYHLMVEIPVEKTLPCGDCLAPHEVFRLPVQDHFAYFVFAPQQDLDGFIHAAHAYEAAQSLSMLHDLHRLLPGAQREEVENNGENVENSFVREKASSMYAERAGNTDGNDIGNETHTRKTKPAS